MSNGDKKCCTDTPNLTLRRIAFDRKDWLDNRKNKVAEIIAEIQGPKDGSKCCPDRKGVKPAIVFILKLDSCGNEQTCNNLKNFGAGDPNYDIDTDGQSMTVTFSGDCDLAKKIDGLVTAYIRIPIECPPTSTPACSCTFDSKKRTTTVKYNQVPRYELIWHAEVEPKAGEDCVIKEIKGAFDKWSPKG